MHVLTKIFVVLVTLLAVVLTPLVVVYAHNEDSYKARHEEARLTAEALRTELANAQARAGADVQIKQSEIAELRNSLAQRQQILDESESDLRRMQSEIATARTFQGETRSQLAVLSEALAAAQQLTERLITDVQDVRGQALDAERRLVELDEAYNEVNSQLEVAIAARRALEEELQALADDHAGALETLAAYRTMYGVIDDTLRNTGRRLADRDINARVVNVSRGGNGQVLAEIDAGSRDGVQDGWVFTIGDGDFIANLRIINVDINRSTGVVELENMTVGSVQPGQRAYIRAGQG